MIKKLNILFKPIIKLVKIITSTLFYMMNFIYFLYFLKIV